MKIKGILYLASFIFLLLGCSEDKMDEINKEINGSTSIQTKDVIPDILLKSAVETTGSDIAWYTTVYIEHSVGTWGQSYEAERRTGQESSSLLNNSWGNLYTVLTSCKLVLEKTDPVTGTEKDNYWARGIAYTMTAYNLAVLTDCWGEVPWTEACQGALKLQPKFDKQSVIYPQIQTLLDSAIFVFNKMAATSVVFNTDLVYSGNALTSKASWLRAAWSLKARYALRLTNINATTASNNALTYLANGFTTAAQGMVFNKFIAGATSENPWHQFKIDRSHLSSSQSLFDLMDDRNDPRTAVYFSLNGGVIKPAPNGSPTQTQGALYSLSLLTTAAAPIPLMSYHELLFIKAEALFRTGGAWQAALQAAIEASFVQKGLTLAAGTTYFTDEVTPLLTPGNELQEIINQKYIAFYEFEAIEAYNDYRRTGFPTLANPLNATVGFVHRFPYGVSEVSSNPANVPAIDIYSDNVWWAGGDEF